MKYQPDPTPELLDSIAAGRFAVVLRGYPCRPLQSFLDTPRGQQPDWPGVQHFLVLVPIDEYRAASEPEQYGDLIGFDVAAFREAQDKIELEDGLRQAGLMD